MELIEQEVDRGIPNTVEPVELMNKCTTNVQVLLHTNYCIQMWKDSKAWSSRSVDTPKVIGGLLSDILNVMISRMGRYITFEAKQEALYQTGFYFDLCHGSCHLLFTSSAVFCVYPTDIELNPLEGRMRFDRYDNADYCVFNQFIFLQCYITLWPCEEWQVSTSGRCFILPCSAKPDSRRFWAKSQERKGTKQ